MKNTPESEMPEIKVITNNEAYIDFISQITEENMERFYPNWQIDEMTPHLIKEFLEPTIKTWVLKKDEKNIGYVMFEEKSWEESKETGIFLISIQVLSAYQKKGFGYYAMKKLEDYVKQKRLNKIELSVDKLNKKAIAFYEHQGYKIYNSDKADLYFEKYL
jgi:ribosomal protein S18 acetylase RimI-like enzyme